MSFLTWIVIAINSLLAMLGNTYADAKTCEEQFISTTKTSTRLTSTPNARWREPRIPITTELIWQDIGARFLWEKKSRDPVILFERVSAQSPMTKESADYEFASTSFTPGGGSHQIFFLIRNRHTREIVYYAQSIQGGWHNVFKYQTADGRANLSTGPSGHISGFFWAQGIKTELHNVDGTAIPALWSHRSRYITP